MLDSGCKELNYLFDFRCSWDDERSQEFKHTNDLFKEEIINDIRNSNHKTEEYFDEL